MLSPIMLLLYFSCQRQRTRRTRGSKRRRRWKHVSESSSLNNIHYASGQFITFSLFAGSAPFYLHGMQRNVILSMNWCQKEKEHCAHRVHSYCIYFIDRLEHEKSQLVNEYNMLYICIVFYCIFFCRLVIKSK